MAINLQIADKKTLDRIERLRGKLPPGEFVSKCFGFGLQQAEAEYRKKQQHVKIPANQSGTPGNKLSLERTRIRYAKLDFRTVYAALNGKDRKHPVRVEVERLSASYLRSLDEYSNRLGGLIPQSLSCNLTAPIEKIATTIAAETFNKNHPRSKLTVH